MNLSQLISELKQVKCPPDAPVYFAVPDEEDIAGECCLVAYDIQVEHAHDEDCTPFVRISVEKPSEENS